MNVDIIKYNKDGYKPLIDFNNWRVAVINSSVNEKKENLKYIERHMRTDEVFVLLRGDAYLIHAGSKKNPEKKYKVGKMQEGIFYNVKKATWHSTIMSKNCKILIVENRDTSSKNSEYYYLKKDDIKKIKI